VADIYLEDQTPLVEARITIAAGSEEEITSLAGLYVNEQADDFLRFEARDGKLFAALDRWILELKQIGDNLFQPGEFPMELQFGRDSHDGGKRVTLCGPLQSPRTYDRIAEPIEDASTWLEYVGTYYSDEVEQRYHIALQGGQLKLSSIKLEASPLRLITGSLFGGVLGRIRFIRDSEGVVCGMRFNSSRIRNFDLVKIA
jgi:hypothetical protein